MTIIVCSNSLLGHPGPYAFTFAVVAFSNISIYFFCFFLENISILDIYFLKSKSFRLCSVSAEATYLVYISRHLSPIEKIEYCKSGKNAAKVTLSKRQLQLLKSFTLKPQNLKHKC